MITDAFGQTICTRQMSPSGMGKKTVRALFTVSALCINESGANGLPRRARRDSAPVCAALAVLLVSHLHQCAGRNLAVLGQLVVFVGQMDNDFPPLPTGDRRAMILGAASSACPLGWHSGGDRLDINRRTIANTPNSPYPHVVLNETASLRHTDFATQFLVHIPQLYWRLIALAYEWNVLRTAFALWQPSMLSEMRY
jgi:hypothetical protein